ncbi:MAG TPA: gliding motility-associated C-terminal domain-containing protein [Puia sp.]|nr:gliding motility-associated C-terminal domain-containing protein [Puia sp.]
MKSFPGVLCLLVCCRTFAQTQSCPLNSSFSAGTLTHWEAYTGNNKNGNGTSAIMKTYDSAVAYPSGTLGAVTLPEYQLSANGMQVISASGTDAYGGFATIPKINGYQYTNSILLGSTNITGRSTTGTTQGGYIRGISYRINVPVSPATQPYTMTYAYAMVLENGSHNSDEQPLFSATLSTNDSVITCASPQYYLPTKNNANTQGGGASLDTAAAIAEGFSLSSTLSPNADPNSTTTNATHLQDVWTKSWREVTFDLSPYRGQQVVLTFETDNCVPGGHFSYAYIALRNTCNGLIISGDSVACTNSDLVYSIPSLTGATYQWTIPSGWSVVSGADSNILTVKAGATGGQITTEEINGCADLKDTIQVTTSLPTLAGSVNSNTRVCTDSNMSVLTITGNRGSVLNWLSSADNGSTWNILSDTTLQDTIQNLTTTTVYRALIRNGASCDIDTSSAAVITVDPKSVGGQLDPSNMEFCLGQFKEAVLTLKGQTGSVLNWQSSTDSTNWTDFTPADTSTSDTIGSLPNSIWYRLLVKSGVCPADTSATAYLDLLNAQFPQATIDPADTTICYGSTALLNASITTGTGYTWTNTATLANQGNGVIDGLPYSINATASPLKSTAYVLSIENTGCPNLLVDTFQVNVYPQILVNAGNDTSVVVGEPLQLQAVSSDTGDAFTWTPATDLNNPDIANPIAILGSNIDSITYTVRATSALGCYGVADIVVRVFKTGADIFVPNAFTPGGATNNIFRPITAGISSLQYFRVYNRWGQLVYSTSALGQGWNGYLNGRLQDTGTYAWMVQGTSYTGKVISRKGVMILVR